MENDMGRECSRNVEERNTYRTFVRKPEGIRLLRILRHGLGG
jgi:hypothetical protein